jgi:hypothetical protein
MSKGTDVIEVGDGDHHRVLFEPGDVLYVCDHWTHELLGTYLVSATGELERIHLS